MLCVNVDFWFVVMDVVVVEKVVVEVVKDFGRVDVMIVNVGM